MQHYPHQVLCMENSPTINQHLSMASHNSVSKNFIDSNSRFEYIPSAKFHEFDKPQVIRSNVIPLLTRNRHLSMPSYDQVNQ